MSTIAEGGVARKARRVKKRDVRSRTHFAGSIAWIVFVGMALVLIGVVIDGVRSGRRSGDNAPKGR